MKYFSLNKCYFNPHSTHIIFYFYSFLIFDVVNDVQGVITFILDAVERQQDQLMLR